MNRIIAPATKLVDMAVDLYRDSALCRALCIGLGLLLGLLVVDAIAGFPTGTRMAYVLPIWFATKKGGKVAGLTLVIATTICLAVADASHAGRTQGIIVNLVLQTGVLYALMYIFDSVESRLRNVTNMATRDSLTGLYNRSAIEEKAKKAIDRATVLNQPLTIAMIDCDRFKELNDHFGHAFGDEVLRLLGKTMRRTFANEGWVGRAGGDEFIIVIPNRDRYQAISSLESMLERFMSHTEIIGRTTGFSYGLAVTGENGFEYDRLMRSADEDMYRRKASRSARLAESLAS